MAQTLRTSVQDFMSAVRSAGSAVGKYTATLNSDGSVKITITATAAVVWNKVYWQIGPGMAATDANISADSVTAIDASNALARVDAQQFLNSLT